LSLGDEDKQKIFEKNALRVYPHLGPKIEKIKAARNL